MNPPSIIAHLLILKFRRLLKTIKTSQMRFARHFPRVRYLGGQFCVPQFLVRAGGSGDGATTDVLQEHRGGGWFAGAGRAGSRHHQPGCAQERRPCRARAGIKRRRPIVFPGFIELIASTLRRHWLARSITRRQLEILTMVLSLDGALQRS